MGKVFDDVNNILARWNPLGVPENIATDEYKSYVPLIIKCADSSEQLIVCLEDVLNKIGADYDSSDKAHLADLQRICHEIIDVTRSAKSDN